MKDNIKLKGIWKFTLRDYITNEVKAVFEYENIVPTVARTMLANNLVSSSPTNDPYINYVAVGTGSNAPANSDTSLQTEILRKVVASSTNANNIAYITGFFTAAEAVATLREAAMFADASAVADSGILMSRVAINIAKSATETLTVDWTLTII